MRKSVTIMFFFEDKSVVSVTGKNLTDAYYRLRLEHPDTNAKKLVYTSFKGY